MSTISTAFHAAKLSLKANAPTIMVVSGIVAMGASVIVASRQTLKVEDILDDRTEELDLEKPTNHPENVKTYNQLAIDLGKLYAVPTVLFVGGAGLVFGGHRILVRRNATLALAFTGLKKSFDLYRSRVKDELGSEYDTKFMSGYFFEEEVDDEGKPTGRLVQSREEDQQDPYNRIFDEFSTTAWHRDLSVNNLFLRHQQKFAQERLNRRGYLYLSDVYEALGFPESDVSRVVGWKVRKNPDGSKDFPVVDFGLNTPHPLDSELAREQAVYLDFNCQGLIVGGNVQKTLDES